MVNKSRNSVIGRLTVQHYLEYYIYHIGMTVRLKVHRPIMNQDVVDNVDLSGCFNVSTHCLQNGDKAGSMLVTKYVVDNHERSFPSPSNATALIPDFRLFPH